MTVKHQLHSKLLILIIVNCLTLSAGCQTQAKRNPEFAAVRPALPPVQPQSNGSIYKPGFDVRLFEDLKARRVGDILTVKLAESMDASKSAETEIDRENLTSVTNPTIFGASPNFDVPGFLPIDPTDDLNFDTSLESNSEFEGEASASQRNALTGNLTVTVVEVLPNGNLYVRGEKRVTINNGPEYIQLSGIVRPVDVLADNSVLSTQIGDATINYIGEGAIAESSFKGWLARFFSGPIFPY